MRKSTNRQLWLLVLSLVGCCCLACRDQPMTPATHGQDQEQLLAAPSGPVSHWVYFPSAEKRAEFVARVKAQGFKVTAEPENDDPAAKYRYGVTLERTDSLDWESTNEAMLELSDLARELGGEYGGWEATVEKDA